MAKRPRLRKTLKSSQKKLLSALVIVIITAAGTYFLAASHAASPFASNEAESGTVGSPASKVSDSTASGGTAVKFGTAPTGGNLCTNPVFTTSAAQGQWPANHGGDYINNNAWNTSEAGPQTLSVCGFGSFYVVSNQPNIASDQGSVKTYPSECGCGFGDQKTLGAYTNITSTFGESSPQMGEWDAGYDMWTDNWANEIMIQNATYNHPPQDGTAVTIDGIAYHALNDGSFIVFGMDSFQATGTVNILHIFQWMIQHGWAKSSDTLTAIGYGVEISYTESSPGVKGPERFDITNYSVTAN